VHVKGSISKLSNSMGIRSRSVSVEISVGDGAPGSVCYPARGRRRPGPGPLLGRVREEPGQARLGQRGVFRSMAIFKG
jgi:hypothetical protein